MKNNIALLRQVTEQVIDTKDWEEFLLKDLFEIEIAKSIDKTKLKCMTNGINYISRMSTNNGLAQKVIPIDSLINKGNCLTMVMVGFRGVTFWQDTDFMASQNILVFRKKGISKNIGLYLASIFTKKFKPKDASYMAIKKSSIEKEKIKLPTVINELGIKEPNWKYMEDYIDSIKTQLRLN